MPRRWDLTMGRPLHGLRIRPCKEREQRHDRQRYRPGEEACWGREHIVPPVSGVAAHDLYYMVKGRMKLLNGCRDRSNYAAKANDNEDRKAKGRVSDGQQTGAPPAAWRLLRAKPDAHRAPGCRDRRVLAQR